MNSASAMVRVIAYVDGFNLYFGLKSSGYGRYLWLNVHSLAESLLLPGQTLCATRYFTSMIGYPADKVKRQRVYIDALGTLNGMFSIDYGRYQYDQKTCRKCLHTHRSSSEKMTDVNIAVRIVEDAYLDRFDTALLISGDSDLCPPISMVKRAFPDKRTIIAFPPGRVSSQLKQTAHGHFVIGRANLASSQFPDKVARGDGFILDRPSTWV